MQISNFSLGIGLPLADDKVHTQFLDSFIRLRKPDNWRYLRPQFPSMNLADIRSAIVAQAQLSGVTHLLMMDTDQTYEIDLIEKLLKDMIENNYPIIGGKVHRRYPPYDPILYELDKEVDKYYLMDDKKWSENEIVEVEATGTGCLLIDMKLFDKIEKPYFKFLTEEESEDGKPVGEDIYFCRKLKEAGIPIHVNTKVQIGHLGLMEVNEHFYFLNKMLNGIRSKEVDKSEDNN